MSEKVEMSELQTKGGRELVECNASIVECNLKLVVSIIVGWLSMMMRRRRKGLKIRK